MSKIEAAGKMLDALPSIFTKKWKDKLDIEKASTIMFWACLPAWVVVVLLWLDVILFRFFGVLL